MTYGRLDVFFPDGLFKTYTLSDPNTTIGRSNTSTIPFDNETLSRYHANITFKVNQVGITDLESENGTFIDGTRLEPNTLHVLIGGEEILIGDLRMIFHSTDENPTRPIEVPEETTQRVELPDLDFFIDIADSYQSVAPGAHISTRISISNESDKAERFIVEITGLPREWVRIDKPELEIAPKASADVLVSFKPLRRSDSRPGDYTVEIGVRLKSKPDLILHGSLNLLVLPYSGFGMALDKPRLKTGERFRLFVHNQGSDTLPLTISGRDLGGALRITLTPSRVELPPGQRAVIQGEARPKSARLFGDPRQHSFDIVARSGDASGFMVAARAYVGENPPLPRWSIFAIGGIGAVLLAVLLFGLVILLRPVPVEPEIVQFAVSANEIAQGDPLALSWTVNNAETLTVSLNGTPVQTVEPGSSGVQIDTAPIPEGVQTFSLIASGGGMEIEAQQNVRITVPLRVRSFTFTPNLLVRYVNQTLTLAWDVPNAALVRLIGLEGFFTTTALADAYPASGSLSVDGIPVTDDPLTVTLIAQSAAGESVEQTLTLDVIDPQCAANADVTLYANPNTGAQVVSTIRGATTVIVNAQDPSGQWLRVELPGGVPGWGQRSGFVCADSFIVDDLFTELIVPTAVLPATVAPTNTGTITVTPSPTRTPRPSPTPSPAG